MEKIRVGIIGAGKIAVGVHIPLLECCKDVKLTYVADVKKIPEGTIPKRIPTITLNEDEQSLPDADIVLLAIPLGAREKYIKECGRRKMAIMTEKPFAPNTEMHKKYLQWSEKIACNYMRAYFSSVGQVQGLLMSGWLGDIKKIEITEGGIVGRTDKDSGHYQTKKELSGGGILMEWGCHTLSQLTEIMKGYSLTVKDASITYANDLDVEVSTIIKAQNKKQSIPINYKISLITPLTTKSRYIGEKGEIVFNHVSPESPVQLLSYEPTKAHQAFILNPGRQGASTFYQAFYLRWMDMLKKVQEQQQFDAMKETSLKTTELITDIYRKEK